jgi:uncharacterized protein YukE
MGDEAFQSVLERMVAAMEKMCGLCEMHADRIAMLEFKMNTWHNKMEAALERLQNAIKQERTK